MLLALALLLAGCAPKTAEWTLLFYVAADNDLEEAELKDLFEILKAPASPRVRLTALVDRSAGRSKARVPGQGDWTGTRWLTLENGVAFQRENWGAQNMADPAVLQRFVRAATQAFPARRYALIIADHGEGWRGACLDEGDQLMTPQAMGQALQGTPLELIALDACLMGTLEVAAALQPRARYLVASEDLLSWSGLAYYQPLAQLARQPQADGRQLGEWLVDGYAGSLLEEDQSTATLALLDLQQLPPLQKAVEELAAQLEHRPWSELARARAASEQFGLSAEPGEPDAAQFDLFDLAGHLSAKLPRDIVVKSFQGPDHPGAGGLAVHFPADPDPAYDFPGWSGLLRTYARGARADRPRLEALQRRGTRLRARLGQPQEVRAAWLVLARDGWVLGRRPTVAQGAWLEDTFEGSWLQFGPGNFCPLEQAQGRRATLPAQWCRLDPPWHDVTLTLQLDSGLISVSRRHQILSLELGDLVRLPSERLRDGELRYQRPALAQLKAEPLPVPPGRYEVGFLIENYAGKRSWQTLPVEVE